MKKNENKKVGRQIRFNSVNFGKNEVMRQTKSKSGKILVVVNKSERVGKMLKNKKKKYYETKQQTMGVKVVERDNTKKLLKSVSVACVVLMTFVLMRFLVVETNGVQYFSEKTTINGVAVGSKTAHEAEQLLRESFSAKASEFKLTLTFNDKSWSFDKTHFEVNSSIHTIIEEAQIRQAANHSYETQRAAVEGITKKGENLMVAFNYIFVGLDEKIDDIIKQIEEEPINSEIMFSPKEKKPFTITKSKDGFKVNKEQLYHEINEAFLQGNDVVVALPTYIYPASITYEDNLARTKKISTFTTGVSDSTGNRKSNVALALQRVNGLVVGAGERVSFNKLTGPHSASNGYKVATIIFNGRFVDGVGGGVCQASTTLYNALLLADVEINQVVKHTLPVKYVPLGQDAMVAEGVADLIFTNNSNHDLYVRTLVTGADVTVEIYGSVPEHGMEIKSRSEVVRKIPHKGDIIKQDIKHEFTDKVLYVGEQYRLTWPRQGFETKTYLDYYKDGKLITSKEIRSETYAPQQGVIIEGTWEKPQEFESTNQSVEKVKAEEVESAFMFSEMMPFNVPDAIPTHYCP